MMTFTLLDVVKLTYRKHHLDDSNIGWNELDDILFNALCDEMGDEAFVKWIHDGAPVHGKKDLMVTRTSPPKGWTP